MLVKWSRLFWIFVLSGAVLIGGAAWLSAHWLSAPGVPAAKEERVAADLGSTRARPGARPVAPEAARPSDTPAVAAGIGRYRAPPRRALRFSRASRRRPRARTRPADAPALGGGRGRCSAPRRPLEGRNPGQPDVRRADVERAGRRFPTGAVPTSPSAAERCARRGSFAAARPRAAAAPTRWPDRAARASARNQRAINPQRINSQ